MGHDVRAYRANNLVEEVAAGAVFLFILVKGIRSPEWPAAVAVLGVPFVLEALRSSANYEPTGLKLMMVAEVAFVAVAGFGLLGRRFKVVRRARGVSI